MIVFQLSRSRRARRLRRIFHALHGGAHELVQPVGNRLSREPESFGLRKLGGHERIGIRRIGRRVQAHLLSIAEHAQPRKEQPGLCGSHGVPAQPAAAAPARRNLSGAGTSSQRHASLSNTHQLFTIQRTMGNTGTNIDFARHATGGPRRAVSARPATNRRRSAHVCLSSGSFAAGWSIHSHLIESDAGTRRIP